MKKNKKSFTVKARRNRVLYALLGMFIALTMVVLSLLQCYEIETLGIMEPLVDHGPFLLWATTGYFFFAAFIATMFLAARSIYDWSAYDHDAEIRMKDLETENTNLHLQVLGHLQMQLHLKMIAELIQSPIGGVESFDDAELN